MGPTLFGERELHLCLREGPDPSCCHSELLFLACIPTEPALPATTGYPFVPHLPSSCVATTLGGIVQPVSRELLVLLIKRGNSHPSPEDIT